MASLEDKILNPQNLQNSAVISHGLKVSLSCGQSSFDFDFIEFVACSKINNKRKEEEERKITWATGEEDRTMSQLIFNPNKIYVNVNKID